MPRKLSESVVVITGASSGIGRATARHFAAKGASLVLAARREDALHEVVVECEQAGGRAIAVLTDVSDQLAVEALARLAIEAFGRIDVWVNNAAVTLFGRFEETPIEDYRRVFETTVFGYIYGARAALPIFREQGSGVLIDVSSVVTRMPQPYTSAYTLSKHAIRALSMSLRQELALDGAKDIHVCTVMPATIDTPFFQHAANFTGRTAKAMPPVYPAENVARMIVRMAERPKREVYVGNAGRLVNLEMKVMPALAERLAATIVDKEHLGDTPAAPTSGNLFEPVPEWNSVDGGWKPNGSSPIPRAAVLGAVAVPEVALMRRRMNDSNGSLIGKLPKPSRSKSLVRRVLS
jgi:NAD(P)-dependent dehydrogenase (short-subunit alcohol dehydrogenase family)